MASAQVVETSVNTNNSPSQDYTTNPDDHLNHNNDGNVEWDTTRCILSVAYRRICNDNPRLWLAVFFKAWDKIQYNTLQNITIHYNILHSSY